jgi:uncharacterized protein YjgD (DUF1641 family)
MLPNLFDVEGKNLVPSQACYAIPWLERIMTLYPNDYLQIYKYIFFTTCPDGTINPYVNLPEDEKEDVVMADLAPLKFSLEDDVIVDTVNKCKKLYETPVLRTFLGAKKMLDKVGRFLDDEEITTGKDGNSSEIRAMLKELSTYWENYNKLENVLKEEQAKVKGDRIIPFHQKEGYKETKRYE